MRNNRKHEKTILILVAAFYIAVTLFAVAMLSIRGSIFTRRAKIKEARQEKKESVMEEVPETKMKAVPNEEPVEEPSTEEPTEASTEASTEAETEEPIEESEPGTSYYEFIANNTAGRLNVRKEPSTKAKIICRLHIGDTGYVLTSGDDWTYVSVSDNQGYIANEYLSLREVSESEYPDELKSLMGTGFPEGEEDEP